MPPHPSLSLAQSRAAEGHVQPLSLPAWGRMQTERAGELLSAESYFCTIFIVIIIIMLSLSMPLLVDTEKTVLVGYSNTKMGKWN